MLVDRRMSPYRMCRNEAVSGTFSRSCRIVTDPLSHAQWLFIDAEVNYRSTEIMDDKTTKQIRNALSGISVPDKWPRIESGVIPLASNRRPPSYIIQLALEAFHGKKLSQGNDKSAWEFPITFEGTDWLLVDCEHHAWNLVTQSGSAESCIRLQKKLEAAGGIVETYLAGIAKDHLDRDDFSLINTFYESRSLYQYYRRRLERAILNADPSLIIGPPGEQRTTLVNEHYRALREAEQNQVVTSLLFFAHTDIILDSCFALQESGSMPYRDFRALDWDRRVTTVVGNACIRRHATLFSHVSEVRRYFRDIPIANPQFLFPGDGGVLVTATADRSDYPRLSYRQRYDIEEGTRILHSFDAMMKLLRDSPRTAYGYLYAESALPIHINRALREELRTFMSSIDDFKQELDRRVQLHYAKINRETLDPRYYNSSTKPVVPVRNLGKTRAAKRCRQSLGGNARMRKVVT